jgi:hypothetical protein
VLARSEDRSTKEENHQLGNVVILKASEALEGTKKGTFAAYIDGVLFSGT